MPCQFSIVNVRTYRAEPTVSRQGKNVKICCCILKSLTLAADFKNFFFFSFSTMKKVGKFKIELLKIRNPVQAKFSDTFLNFLPWSKTARRAAAAPAKENLSENVKHFLENWFVHVLLPPWKELVHLHIINCVVLYSILND